MLLQLLLLLRKCMLLLLCLVYPNGDRPATVWTTTTALYILHNQPKCLRAGSSKNNSYVRTQAENISRVCYQQATTALLPLYPSSHTAAAVATVGATTPRMTATPKNNIHTYARKYRHTPIIIGGIRCRQAMPPKTTAAFESLLHRATATACAGFLRSLLSVVPPCLLLLENTYKVTNR